MLYNNIYIPSRSVGDEDHWISTETGSHILLGEGGEIKAGMGGKFNGQKIGEVVKTWKVDSEGKALNTAHEKKAPGEGGNPKIISAIKEHNIRLAVGKQEGGILVPNGQKLSPDVIKFLKENKAEIVKELKSQQAAKDKEHAEKEKNTSRFHVSGWESHEISIDRRKDLNEQFEKIANYYKNDGITPQMVKNQYEQHLSQQKTKQAERIDAARKYIQEAEGKSLPTRAQAEKENRDWQRRNQSSYLPPVGHTKEGLEEAKRILSESEKEET